MANELPFFRGRGPFAVCLPGSTIRLARAGARWRETVRRMTTIGQLRQFAENVQMEMRKVSWPDQDQLRNATLVILAFTIITAAIIGAMDALFSMLIRFIVGAFSG